MSTTLDILRPPDVSDMAEPVFAEEAIEELSPNLWSPETFAREQIHGLVRQVFLPGWPKPSQQVVFSSIDQTTDVAEVCAQVGMDLAAQTAGSICLVEANPASRALELLMSKPEEEEKTYRTLTSKGPKPIADNLWLLSSKDFLGPDPRKMSASRLRASLTDLRRDFEYAIIHAPVASLCSASALLGQLSDGVILVLQAHFTRRIAARKAKENLQSVNARLLGTVLSERTFPIPERLYRRL